MFQWHGRKDQAYYMPQALLLPAMPPEHDIWLFVLCALMLHLSCRSPELGQGLSSPPNRCNLFLVQFLQPGQCRLLPWNLILRRERSGSCRCRGAGECKRRPPAPPPAPLSPPSPPASPRELSLTMPPTADAWHAHYIAAVPCSTYATGTRLWPLHH